MTAVPRFAAWQRLRAAGIAAGEFPAAAAVAEPWYVRAMIGAAAWIGAVFLLAAVLAALPNLFRSGGPMLAVGLVLCGGAVVAMRAGARNAFLAQFAFALSLAGQGLFAAGVFSGAGAGAAHGGHFDAIRFLAIGAFEVCLVLLAPAYVHRTLSTLVAAVALGGALIEWRAGELFAPAVALAFALCALAGTRDGQRLALWQPVAAGLALALVVAIAVRAVQPLAAQVGTLARGTPLPPWTGHAAMGAVFAAVIALLLREAGVRGVSRTGLAAWIAAVVVAVASWYVSGLLGAGILLLVAFAVGHEVLLGLGAFAVLATLSRYYYGLEATLLVKAAALGAIGIALLAARLGLRLLPAAPEEGERA